MDLAKKIEEIKRKPEHIRLRYVWFFVAMSMVVVLFVWFFSLKIQMAQFNGSENKMPESFSATVNDFNTQSKSLKDAVNNTKVLINDDAVVN